MFVLNRLLTLLIRAWFFTALICAWLLAALTFFLLVQSIAASKQYVARGGQLPERLTEVARRFGIIPSSPDKV